MAVQTAPDISARPAPPEARVEPKQPDLQRPWGFGPPHRFSVEQYETMVETGILTRSDKCELIHGVIVAMSPIGGPHSKYVTLLTRLLIGLYPDPWVARPQLPIRLSDSEPEPDLAVCRAKDDLYESGHPAAADVALLVEVSETSLRFDREVKSRLYATEGVPEYWGIDIEGRSVDVFREPSDIGYGFMKRHQAGDLIDLPAIENARLAVDQLFPPPKSK